MLGVRAKIQLIGRYSYEINPKKGDQKIEREKILMTEMGVISPPGNDKKTAGRPAWFTRFAIAAFAIYLLMLPGPQEAACSQGLSW